MLFPQRLAVLVGLREVILAQQFDMDSTLQYSELVPDVMGLSNRQMSAVEAFDPAVIDADLAEWEAKVAPGNRAVPACPADCNTVGLQPDAWAVFRDASDLKLCNKTLLLDLAVFTVAHDQQEANAIRACSADQSLSSAKPARRQSGNKSCIPASEVDISVPVQLKASGSATMGPSVSEPLFTAGRQIASYLGQVEADCDTSALSRFAITPDNAVIGVYVGAQAHRQGITAQFVDKVLSGIATNEMSEGFVAEICMQGGVRLGADYVVGIAASTKPDGLRIVQNAVRQWSNGTCLTTGSPTNPLASLSLRIPTSVDKNSTLMASNTTLASTGNDRAATKRAECRYIRVASGDSCAALASKCGISGADFTKYNPSSTLCSSLREG
jgi:hypothetical protein